MNSDNYEKHEGGNQLPYSALEEYLQDHYVTKYPDLDIDHVM